MNLKTRIKELAAKAETVTEFGMMSKPARRVASFLDKRMGLTAGERRSLDPYRGTDSFSDLLGPAERKSNRERLAKAARWIRAKERHTQLAAKAEAVTEFARGDFANPAIKRILARTNNYSLHKLTKDSHIGIAPSLRGDADGVKRALGGYLHTRQAASNPAAVAAEMKKNRDWAARTLRGVRKAQEADELADVPFYSRHPGMKISDAIQRRY